MSVGTVIIAHQVSWRRCPGKRLGDLPGQPTRRSDAASPRTTATVAGHGPGPETQTRDQRSASERRTYRLRRSPQSDFEEMSSRFATAASEVATCISRPSTGRLRTEHQKLAMDPGCAPQRIFLAHPSDEIAQATIDLRPLKRFDRWAE